jgi:hypothetical protein
VETEPTRVARQLYHQPCRIARREVDVTAAVDAWLPNTSTRRTSGQYRGLTAAQVPTDAVRARLERLAGRSPTVTSASRSTGPRSRLAPSPSS